MRHKMILAAAIVLAFCFPAFAQSTVVGGGMAGGSNYRFYYRAYLEPSPPALGPLGGGTVGGNGAVHRFMKDDRQHVYFGYDVLVETLPDPDKFRVTFSPLTLQPADLHFRDATVWTALPAPDWHGPAVRIIEAGDVLALDLLTNGTTGQKITEYVTVQKPSAPEPNLGPLSRGVVTETGVARDFRADDAIMEIHAENININGNPVRFSNGMTGPSVYFYLPRYGQYILSLTPHPELGFKKAGEIRGSTLTFTAGDQNVTIVSTGSVAPGAGPFNLYVRYDPKWQPSDRNPASPEAGAASRPQDLIRPVMRTAERCKEFSRGLSERSERYLRSAQP